MPDAEPELRPRPQRFPMVARLEIFERGRRIGSVFTRNISRRGVGGRGYVLLSVNQQVSVTLDDCPPIPARVAWHKGGDFGLELKGALDLSHFDCVATLSGPLRTA